MNQNNGFVPLYTDLLFKEGFAREENRQFLERFLEVMLDLPRGCYHKRLDVRYESPLGKGDYSDKSLRGDLLIYVDDFIINLEAYSQFDKEAYEKTVSYAFNLASSTHVGKEEKNLKPVIQLVFIKKMNIKFSKRRLNHYHIINENNIDDILFKENFGIHIFRLDNAEAYNYNESEKDRWLAFISADTKDLRKEIARGDEEMMVFDKNLNDYVMDKKTKQFYREWDRQIYEKRVERIRQEGATAKSKEIARMMISENLSIDVISRTTGLSESKIKDLMN